MSIFSSIMNAVMPHKSDPAPAPAAAETVTPTADAAPPPPPPPPPAPVNVEEVLEGLAAQKGGGGNWRVSIVDLLSLLGLESSLSARAQLANELNCHVGANGSAAENEALIKAVWAELEKNGGVIPASLKG